VTTLKVVEGIEVPRVCALLVSCNERGAVCDAGGAACTRSRHCGRLIDRGEGRLTLEPDVRSWVGADAGTGIVNAIPPRLQSEHDEAGILFTSRWNHRSRCPGNLVHDEPEYAVKPSTWVGRTLQAALLPAIQVMPLVTAADTS
jgi:hypothetical protein